MDSFSLCTPGMIMIGIGIAINFFVRRRKFYRRNQYGIEVYENFASASANGCLNRFASLISTGCIIIGIVLCFGGCLSTAFHHRQLPAHSHMATHNAKK